MIFFIRFVFKIGRYKGEAGICKSIKKNVKLGKSNVKDCKRNANYHIRIDFYLLLLLQRNRSPV